MAQALDLAGITGQEGTIGRGKDVSFPLDLRVAAPWLLRTLGLVIIVVLTLALGVGVEDVVGPGGFVDWIDDLYNSGVAADGSTAPWMYCPDGPVDWGQMAVPIAGAFGLP